MLLSVIILAGVLRFYNLAYFPVGLSVDEASLAYDAYAVLHPKENFTTPGPFLYGDTTAPRWPVSVYDQLPTIALLGLNDFSARATAAIIGTLTVIVVFFLTKELLKKDSIALLASFCTAISPWHLQFSRLNTENIRTPFYFSLFLLFWLIGMRKQNKIYLFLSLVFLFLCMYSYTAAIPFVLLMVAGMGWMYRHYLHEHKKTAWLFFCLMLVSCVPFIWYMIALPSTNRLSQVSIFAHRSLLQAVQYMATTYMQSYSPDFLFFKGDTGMPHHFIVRYSVTGMGELYLLTAPFLIIGIFLLIKNRKQIASQLLLLWLVLYPVGSVLAWSDGGGVFASRSIPGVLIFQILTAYGIVACFIWCKPFLVKTVFSCGMIFLFIISCIAYLYNYYFVYPLASVGLQGFQYGARQIVTYYVQHQAKYDDLVFLPPFVYPQLYARFYLHTSCSKCRIGLPLPLINGYYVVNGYYAYAPYRKQLYALPPWFIRLHPELYFKKQTEIHYVYPLRGVAFEIGEVRR